MLILILTTSSSLNTFINNTIVTKYEFIVIFKFLLTFYNFLNHNIIILIKYYGPLIIFLTMNINK